MINKYKHSFQHQLIIHLLILLVLLVSSYFCFYSLLINQKRQQTEATYQLVVNNFEAYHSYKLDIFDINTFIKQNGLQNYQYQLLLITPSGDTKIKAKIDKVNDTEDSVFDLPKDLAEKADSKSTVANKIVTNNHVEGWAFNNKYKLHINIVRQPLEIPLWWSLFPMVVFLALVIQIIRWYIHHKSAWRQLLKYVVDMATPADSKTQFKTYQPLSLNHNNVDKELVYLGHLLSRINHQRHHRQLKAKSLQHRFKQLVEHAPAPLVLVRRNGNIQFINNRFKHVFMMSLNKDSKLKLTDIVTGMHKLDTQILNNLHNQRVSQTLLVTSFHSNRCYQMHIMPWFAEHGQIHGYTVMFNDVSHLNQQLNQLTHDLKRSTTRLSDFDKLWSVLGHELRTPLSGIIGMIELMNVDSLNPEQKETFQTLAQTSQTMLNMLNDMLDMAKLDAGKLQLNIEKVDVLKLCRQVCDLMIGNARRQNIELLYFFDPNFPRYISTDEARLTQVLMNLISNAIKFTTSGYVAIIATVVKSPPIKTVTSILKNHHADSSSKLHNLSPTPQTWICFEVKDTGIGISAEEQKKLFAYFNQANDSISRQFGGTGLGLAISKNFIQMLGGNIELESEKQQGSSFCVNLPTDHLSDQSVYNFDANLSELCVVVLTNQDITAEYLTKVFNHLKLSSIVQVGLTENTADVLTQFITTKKQQGLHPVLLLEHEAILAASDTLLNLLPDKTQIPKLLLTMMPERQIETNLIENYSGCLHKPLDLSHLISELMRLTQPEKYMNNANYKLSKVQQSFNQFLDKIGKNQLDNGYQTNNLIDDSEYLDGNLTDNLSNDLLSQTQTELPTIVRSDEQPLILIAEDNPINQKVAVKLLQKLGYRTIVANNGEEALNQLHEHRHDIRVILMDCRMPVMDGLTATRKIRSNQNSIPIIALTANNTDSDRKACIDAGMDSFLSKPIKKKELNELLSNYLI